MAMTPMTTASSASSNLSLASIGSPVLAAMTDASFKEESRRQEYGFEKEDGWYNKRALIWAAAKQSLRLSMLSGIAHGAGCQVATPGSGSAHHLHALQ